MTDTFDSDDVAGIVDMFGALTHDELAAALSELAFRHGSEVDESEAIESAIESFSLVAFTPESDDESLIAAGPNAFPMVPDGAEDLPHILDVEPRTIDREAVGREAERRLRREAAQAIDAGDRDRAMVLVDASYDLEAWAPVDLNDIRTQLEGIEDGTN